MRLKLHHRHNNQQQQQQQQHHQRVDGACSTKQLSLPQEQQQHEQQTAYEVEVEFYLN